MGPCPNGSTRFSDTASPWRITCGSCLFVRATGPQQPPMDLDGSNGALVVVRRMGKAVRIVASSAQR